jgi:hypothetical protein
MIASRLSEETRPAFMLNLHTGIEILSTWLARGECNKRNCGTFYSLVQAANTHVKRLLTDQVPVHTRAREGFGLGQGS